MIMQIVWSTDHCLSPLAEPCSVLLLVPAMHQPRDSTQHPRFIGHLVASSRLLRYCWLQLLYRLSSAPVLR